MFLQIHLKISDLLRGPFGLGVGRAGRDPDSPRSHVNEDKEIQVDQAVNRPFPF